MNDVGKKCIRSHFFLTCYASLNSSKKKFFFSQLFKVTRRIDRINSPHSEFSEVK